MNKSKLTFLLFLLGVAVSVAFGPARIFEYCSLLICVLVNLWAQVLFSIFLSLSFCFHTRFKRKTLLLYRLEKARMAMRFYILVPGAPELVKLFNKLLLKLERLRQPEHHCIKIAMFSRF